MSVTATLTAADTIIFAINSAIKLSRNLRDAYVKKVQEKELLLPLPDYNPSITLETINFFFDTNEYYLDKWDELRRLRQNANDEEGLTKEEKTEYQQYYLSLKAQQEGRGAYAQMSPEELFSLFSLHGAKKEENTVLQVAAASLVDIGVDYFTQVPGALNRNSVHGEVLFHFLSAFDEIDLKEHSEIKKEFSDKLLPRLFAAAAESVVGLSDDISKDENFQRLIKATAKGIANDLYKRIEQLEEPSKREESVRWGQLVLRSMIKNAGGYALASPEAFVDANEGGLAIIQSTGLVLLETILEDDSERVAFRKALNPETLDRLVKASLAVLAEHPELISRQQGIKAILKNVAAVVQQDDELLEKGLLPELARIVLEQSAGHLDQLWEGTEGGQEHLLIMALRELLILLSKPSPDGGWKPQFTKTQLLDLIEELLEEVVHNPAWVLAEVRRKPVLAEVVRVSLQALSQIPKKERLQPEVLRTIIRLNIETTLTHPRVIELVPWEEEEDGVIVLQKALELVVAFVFAPEEGPRVNRLELLMDLLEYITDVILREHPNRKGLLLVQLLLFDSGIDYSQGFNRRLVDELTDAALEVLASHPELAEKPGAFRQILAGVFSALDSAKIREPDLVARLLQLMLRQTALHTHLVIQAEDGQPKLLLVMALQQLLESLAADGEAGPWKPHITPGQLEQLLIGLLDEVVQHPYWLTEKLEEHALLKKVVEGTFQALKAVPPTERLSPATLEMLLRLCLRIAAASPQVLEDEWFAGEEEKQQVLQQALELVFAFVASPEDQHGSRLLLLPELLEFVLGRLLQRYPDKRGLILIDLILFEENGIDYSQGFQPELAEQLADSALRVLTQHPDLVSNKVVLKEIIVNIAENLKSLDLERPELLRRLIHLALDSTAEHIDLLREGRDVKSRHLLIMASWEVLSALTQPTEEGEWKPRLTDEQIIDLIERVFEATLENPKWAEEPLSQLLNAIFKALQQMPPGTAVPYALLRHIIERALEAANRQPTLLVDITTATGSKKLRLQLGLEQFIAELYGEEGQREADWHVSQSRIIEQLLGYYLRILSATPVQEEDMAQARAAIRAAITHWQEDLSKDLSEILEELQNAS